MRRAAALAAAATLALLAGCGGGSPQQALSQTAGKLGKIRSGDISFDLSVTPRSDAGGRAFGYRLHGPFAFGQNGSLPRARVDYTQIANGQSASVTIVSTGDEGFVLVGGKAYALPADRLAPLRGANTLLQGGGGGLRELRIDQWIHDAKLSGGGQVGGADTDHVHADLDVVRAINALGVTGRIAGAEAKRLRDATRSATIDVWTGKKDRLLRKLTVDIDFGLDVPKDLQRTLGKLVGAHVVISLGVADPNRKVEVQRPASPLPFSELPHG